MQLQQLCQCVSLVLWICHGVADASTLDYPRIHFIGKHLADVNTINNDPYNYKLSLPLHQFYHGWHPSGGNEWSLQDCTVTSVVYQNGSHTMDPRVDPLIGAAVETNPFSVEGKIVSIDVFAQNKSILFGVTLGVKQSAHSHDFAFTGEWLPNSVLHQNAWRQVLCDDSDLDTHYDGARSVSRLRNVKWDDSLESEVMRQLKDASKRHGGELAVSVALFDFSYDPNLGNFSYGRISGTIGIARRNEPRFFEGERLLSFEFVDQPKLTWPEDDSCSRLRYTPWRPFWAYRAPFKVHNKRRVLTVDFSSSFARNLHGGVRDIGDLFLGVLRSPDRRHVCIDLIATINYHKDKCRERNACVIDYPLDKYQFELVQKHLLVVVRPRGQLSSTATTYPLCIAPVLDALGRRWRRHSRSYDMVVMMLEQYHYIRPYKHYTFFMEKGDVAFVDFLVTSLGKPASGRTVQLKSVTPWVEPSNGVTFNREAIVNSVGHAKFAFIANSIGYPRRELDLDGQVYQYVYHVKRDPVFCHDEVKIAEGTEFVEATCSDAVTLKLFSDISYDNHPFTWVDHVEPILSQYARLYPQMKTVVDLGVYEDVVKPQMIRLLNFTLLLDISHPNHMPVTRDLSATKRKMILEWLGRPCFNSTQCVISNPQSRLLDKGKTQLRNEANGTYYASNFPSCGMAGDFKQQPHDSDDYFGLTARFDPKFGTVQGTNCFTDLKRNKCSTRDIQHCLQKAMELEFYTIPLYLTALYSIKDGYNHEVYHLIRSVVMQEMLHMLQVANLLISIGGKPSINSASAAPRYPAKGLPGGVLPQLEVSLQKASLRHIHKVFMAIEYPHEIFNVRDGIDAIHKQTIGQFYHEIRNCLSDRGDDIIFSNSTVLQIDWPYSNDYGHVYVVEDLATALKAIEEIVEQGEGMQPGDPRSNRRDDLAHFFKFQEIVCGRELQFYGVSNYSFTGPPIPFDEEGVWMMRDNPGSKGLTPGTQTYNRAQVFHQTYRSLLRKLDEVFEGSPSGISDAMSIMESLGLQAKILMTMPMEDSPGMGMEKRTCGPVFDYEWTD